MLSNESITHLILSTTGLLVRFNEDPEYFNRRAIRSVPGEKLENWKSRVFGDPDIDIEIYRPRKVLDSAPMKKILERRDADYVKSVFTKIDKRMKKEIAAEDKKQKRPACKPRQTRFAPLLMHALTTWKSRPSSS